MPAVYPLQPVFETSGYIFSIEVKIDMSNRNAGTGGAWYKSANVKKAMDIAVLEAMQLIPDKYKDELPLPLKVNLVVTRIVGKGQRFFDPDSVLRGDAKQLIDAIVTCGILRDDSYRNIDYVLGRQDSTRRKEGPMVTVDFYRA